MSDQPFPKKHKFQENFYNKNVFTKQNKGDAKSQIMIYLCEAKNMSNLCGDIIRSLVKDQESYVSILLVNNFQYDNCPQFMEQTIFDQRVLVHLLVKLVMQNIYGFIILRNL